MKKICFEVSNGSVKSLKRGNQSYKFKNDGITIAELLSLPKFKDMIEHGEKLTDWALFLDLYFSDIDNSRYKNALSKFETNRKEDVSTIKSLVDSLSDKLGIPFRYDSELKTAGAFIDGQVVLNMNKLDETTVWHEFSHPFVQAIRRYNKPLYDSLINEIYNTPHGKKLLKEVESLYSDASKKVQEEEVIVELIARYASGRIDGFTGKKYEGIWDMIKQIIAKIGNMIFKNGATNIAKEMSPILNETFSVLSMNQNMTVKELSSVLKHGGIINLSKYHTEFENDAYATKLELENKIKNLNKELESETDLEKIELIKNSISKAQEYIKQRLKKNKPNSKTVKDVNGVFHNIGAYMNNGGFSTTVEALDNFTNILQDGKMELACWDGLGNKFEQGTVRIEFKDDAPVKMSFKHDVGTSLFNTYEEKERLTGNFTSENKKYEKQDIGYTESIMVATKDNIKSITILNYARVLSGSYKKSLIKLSKLTGAPILGEWREDGRPIYGKETEVGYEPEIYESRFGNKDINKQSPEAIYKEVEEVFIKMRLDDSSQHTPEKIQSFEEFIGSIFENINDSSKFNVSKLLIKTPNYSNYLLNKSKFQIELMKRNLMYETDTNKIEVFNAIVEVLESKVSIFETVNATENIDLVSEIAKSIKETDEKDKGLMPIALVGLLFPILNEGALSGAIPYITAYGVVNAGIIATYFAAGPIMSAFKYVKTSINNLFVNRQNKILKKLEDNFAINSLMNKKDVNSYIKILKEKLNSSSSKSVIEGMINKLELINSKLDIIGNNMNVLTENKYQSYMNDLLKAHGDRDSSESNLVESMIDKINKGEYVPKFVMNYAVQSGLTVENNYKNRNLFAERLIDFLRAYSAENLRNTPEDLNNLLGDYNINQILEPGRYENQVKLANALLKDKSDVIGKNDTQKDLSSLDRKELEELIESGDDLYVDVAKRMLYALNEKEAKTGESTHEKDEQTDLGKLRIPNRGLRLDQSKPKEIKPKETTSTLYDLNTISSIEFLWRDGAKVIEHKNAFKIASLLITIRTDKKMVDIYQDTFDKHISEDYNTLQLDKIKSAENILKSNIDKLKILQIDSLKTILSEYGTSYDSFSPQLKSQIETKLTNNPELISDLNFIKSLTCL